MKINIIVPFVELTGGIKVAFTYANELKRRGHDVLIYYPLIPYRMNTSGITYLKKIIKSIAKGVLKNNWKVHWFNLQVPYKMVPSIKWATIRDADVTLATAWPTAYDVANMSDSKGRKYYFVQHYELWSGPKALVDGSYRLPLRKIVIAGWLKNLMEREFSSSADIVYNGIDFHEFYPERNRNINTNDDIKILMLAHPVDMKGMKDGIYAVEEIRGKGYAVQLDMFGNGKIEDIPEYSMFHCSPSRKELRQLYSNADIYIFPSWSEGWGLTVLEAMACKCAVVGNNVGCLLDIGVHRETAMLSEPHDIDKMVKNIEELIGNRELLYHIKEKGYQVSKRFSWENSYDRFEKVLEK